MAINKPAVGQEEWGPVLNQALTDLDSATAAEIVARTGTDTAIEADIATAQSDITSLSALIAPAVPNIYKATESVLSGSRRSYGGQDFQALQDIPTGIPPVPLGDASIADRQIVLAGRAGYARNTTGGDGFNVYTVNTTNDTGAGSFRQALADAKANGGGYIIWDPAGGASGTYVHYFSSKVLPPSNITINAWGPVNAGHPPVEFQGFGADDTRSFFIGGQDGNDFTTYYGSVPVHDVIVTGIKFNCNEGVSDSHGDVMAIRFWAQNIWIDHCYFTNPQKLTDGMCDTTWGSNSVTFSWCEFYNHHKAVLVHSKKQVSSPTGNDLPPGVTKASPGSYTVQTTEEGIDTVQVRVSFIHCLFNGLAQRSPLIDHDATYVHMAGCWVRNFGNYFDGVNVAVNGLNDWPITTGSRWSETANLGPSLGPTGAGTSVPGTYVANTGGGSKVINDAKLLSENCCYTGLTGSTTTTDPIANDGGGGNAIKTVNNTYQGCTALADVNPSNATSPPYTLPYGVVPSTSLPTGTIRNGTGPQGNAYWQYVGGSVAGTSLLVQQAGAAVGGVKAINFTGSAFGTITYNSGTQVATVPAAQGAADPTTILLNGTHAARPAASTPNIGKYYFETDTTKLFQCTNSTTWTQVTGPITPLVVPGQEIGYVEYWPSGANTNASTTSTSLVDLAGLAVTATWTSNAANMFDVTFTVPPSGNVDVLLTAMTSASGSIAQGWALYDVGGAALVTNSEMQVSNSSGQIHYTYRCKVTGLTPGVSKTYRFQVRMQSAGTLTIYSGGTKGPVQMRVLASE